MKETPKQDIVSSSSLPSIQLFDYFHKPLKNHVIYEEGSNYVGVENKLTGRCYILDIPVDWRDQSGYISYNDAIDEYLYCIPNEKFYFRGPLKLNEEALEEIHNQSDFDIEKLDNTAFIENLLTCKDIKKSVRNKLNKQLKLLVGKDMEEWNKYCKDHSRIPQEQQDDDEDDGVEKVLKFTD